MDQLQQLKVKKGFFVLIFGLETGASDHYLCFKTYPFIILILFHYFSSQLVFVFVICKIMSQRRVFDIYDGAIQHLEQRKDEMMIH